ncbi:MAG: formylmethanofuran dehydrogenase subunit E family protein [Deltaproteobacteria bacterium]|nr:formylmethanofuran dehydrogenase subunit E family protein [Deltaproteobacteria bacterium]
MKSARLYGIAYEDFLIEMEAFHGHRSPGVLLGGLMLDTVLKELESTPYLNIACETVICLPDAIQILTPCTFGNGFLQVLDWGKFALTAYDRQTLTGVRGWLDLDRLPEYPLVHNWFERTGRPREKPPFDLLAEEMLTAAPQLIAQGPVRLHRALKDPNPVPTGRCPKCSESYPLHLGPACPSCSDKGYYDVEIDNP